MNNVWRALGALGVRSTVLSRGRILITVCSPVTGVSYNSSKPTEQKHISTLRLDVRKGSASFCPILVRTKRSPRGKGFSLTIRPHYVCIYFHLS